MAYTSTKGYTYDVFVSYANADNEPVLRSKTQWVTNFVDDLNKFLTKRLGNRPGQTPEIFIDHELAKNIPLTRSLPESIKNSATYLIIMSPAYLESDWCTFERKHFFDNLKKRGSDTRVFIIEIDEVDRSRFPLEINGLSVISNKFWVKTAESEVLTLGITSKDTDDYYARLMDLTKDLARELQSIKNGSSQIEDIELPGPERTVFLAEVTDDLDEKREEIRRYLKDHGYRVIPDENGYNTYEANALEANILNNLNNSTLYVQLISDLQGKKIMGGQGTITSVQYELAKKVKDHLFLWCSPSLKTDNVKESSLRQLIESEYTRKESFEDFKPAILNAMTQPQEQASDPTDRFVYICTDLKDWNYSDTVIKEQIKTAGFGYSLSLKSRKAAVVRNYQRQNFIESYATLFVYCETEPDTVLIHILECAKVKALRKEPFKIVAIYDGPPKEEDEGQIDIHLPSLSIQNLNCRKSMSEFVENFLKKL